MKVAQQVPRLSSSPARAGFNHNVKYGGRIFHVQTEASGAATGHIFTHLFHDGQVVSSSKVDYDAVSAGDHQREYIGRLMRESHRAMARSLCRGMFDDRLDIGRGGPKLLSDTSERSSVTLDPIQLLREAIDMDNIMKSLNTLTAEIAGALGVALVDFESGLCLGAVGNGAINIEVAAAGNMEVVRAKNRVMRDLGIEGQIEDILITLASQYHIIRPLNSKLFLYVAFDRKTGNLAMARHKIAAVGATLVV